MPATDAIVVDGRDYTIPYRTSIPFEVMKVCNDLEHCANLFLSKLFMVLLTNNCFETAAGQIVCKKN